MPSKIITSEGNYLSFSQVLSRNMGSLNGNPNIVNLLYVLDRPPVPNLNELNELNQANRLEPMQNILEQNDSNSDSQQQQNDNKQLINKSYDNFINLPKKETKSTNFNYNKSYDSLEHVDLINLNDEIREDKSIFCVPFINSKNYRPDYGLHCNQLLYNGSRFVGHQRSKGVSYKVEVIFKKVDLDNLYMCGTLQINGLVEEYPSLTTFFDCEIISERYPFYTRKYDADYDVDKKHWSKFVGFFGFSDLFNGKETNYAKLRKSNFIFMRWKEHFIINDHKVRDVNSFSFAGFYYILLNKLKGTIEGFYYHKHSELFQSLNLEYKPPQKTTGIYEFR